MNLRTWVEKAVGHFVSARLFKIAGLDPLMEGSREELHRALHEAVRKYPGVFPRDVVRLAETYRTATWASVEETPAEMPAEQVQKAAETEETEAKREEASEEVADGAEVKKRGKKGSRKRKGGR